MLLLGHLSIGTARALPTCQSDQALQPPGRELPHMAAALRDGRRLDILAVGPATMLGPRLKPAASFPARTVQMLREARPGSDIRLVTQAERGASAAELLTILRRQIVANPSALILWQAGTADAARGGSPAEFETILHEGVTTAQAAGSDIVLIDPPFSRLLSSRADPARYNAAFLEAASVPGAAVFSRYSLTRQWVDSGELDLEQAASGDRGATLARLHECLAHALAQALLAAALSGPASTASR